MQATEGTADVRQPGVPVPPTVSTPPPGDGSTPRRSARTGARGMAARYGVLGTFAATILLFSVLRPETFLTLNNLRTMLTEIAPLVIASIGVTVVLVMNDFDLSIGSMITLSGTVTVYLIYRSGTPWPMAVLGGVGAGLAVGLLNGVLVAGARASSFIVTLAMGTVLSGVESRLSNSQSIFGQPPSGFSALANKTLGTLPLQVWIAGGVVLVVWVLLERSVSGRSMYAVGGNFDAARLSGIPVTRTRLVGFVIVAACAALAGVLISAQSGTSTPGVGLPLLLPIYAASFLGSTVLRPGTFTVLGTVIGSMFLQVISTGLILLDLATPVVSIVQGAILIVAVLLARIGAAE